MVTYLINLSEENTIFKGRTKATGAGGNPGFRTCKKRDKAGGEIEGGQKGGEDDPSGQS